VESRAFPAFVCDPGAGPDWASRFSLNANPQAERDWPVHALGWEDAGHQRQGEMVAFTLVDFLACDRRVAPHLARIAPDAWNGHLVAVAEAMAPPQPDPGNRMPCLIMADAQEGLHKVLADDILLHETRRCLDRWHVLQELGGIHNSYAARQVEAARLEWATQAAPVPPPATPPAAEPPMPEATPPEEAAEPEPEPGEPYIESVRCTTCNECITVNNRMFAYDANRKASIVDLTAGTFRQLVEAAENCPVSIIHPGKPRDPNEPGLAELLTQAAPFL
jgi:ferredoxin